MSCSSMMAMMERYVRPQDEIRTDCNLKMDTAAWKWFHQSIVFIGKKDFWCACILAATMMCCSKLCTKLYAAAALYNAAVCGGLQRCRRCRGFKTVRKALVSENLSAGSLSALQHGCFICSGPRAALISGPLL